MDKILSPEQIQQMIDDARRRSRLRSSELPPVDPPGVTADKGSSRPSWREGIITARALQTKQFKPVRIILPELIPEGVTINAGKPKIGKSWFALDICVAVAGHRFVLGDRQPVEGDVLYLALEDNQRRLKKRMHKIMGDQSWPERLEMHTEWKRLDQGGLGDIEEWCKSKPGRLLIWIDTLAKIRPLVGKGEPAYAGDYRAIEGLQELAGKYQVGVVLNHHLRKASSEDDAFDDVSGTLGLTGAADTIIVMKRHAGMVKIFVRGRDIEEGEFAAEFNRESCRWRLVGTADDVFRSQERQAVLKALKGAPAEGMSLADLKDATQRKDGAALKVLLFKMKQDGEVTSPKRGLYAAAPKPKANPEGYQVNDGYFGVGNQFGDDNSLAENGNLDADAHDYRGYRNIEVDDEGADPLDPVNHGNLGGPPSQPIEVSEVSAPKMVAGDGNRPHTAPLTGNHGGKIVAADNDLDTANDPHRCAYCGQPGTAADPLRHGHYRPRKPEGDWLHARCKHPWQAGGWRRK